MAEKTEPMRLSDAEALIENVVRKQVPEVGEVWFWGSPTGSRSARGADGRSLYAYWQTDVQRHELLIPRMAQLREALESLDEVDAVRVRNYQPDTGRTGKPAVGEQWEIRLSVDVAGPATRTRT